MTLASTRVSPAMAAFPRSVFSIAIAIGGLAAFFVFASWLLVSYPIGSTVSGYFYGVDGPKQVDFPASLGNETTTDSHQSSDSEIMSRGASSEPSSGSNDGLGTSAVDKDIVVANQNFSQSESNLQVSISSSGSSPDLETDKLGEEAKQKEETKPFPISGDLPVSSTRTSPDLETSKKLDQESVQEEETQSVPTPSNTTGSLNITGTSDIDTGKSKRSNSSDDSETGPVLPPASLSSNTVKPDPSESECDLYHGSWFYDPLGALYTNNSCPIITQMQNCQGNGRPDSEYENWRWRPSQCELPRFNAKKFFELMRGKTLAFIGDSVARNQMESMMCLLWQVEAPVNRGSRKMQRWHFQSANVMIARMWSSWLVHQFSEAFDFAPKGVAKLSLDLPDERIMEAIPKFDVVVLSSGHWFAKQSVYILNNEIVGGQLWWPDKSKPMKVNNIDAFGISVETILTAMATHPNYTGLTILRSFSPDHYEGGAWNTGGSCTGKTQPLGPGELVKNGFTEIMHEKQVAGFNRAIKKVSNSSKLKLMDITQAFEYRHDGHPGPYRSPDPNKKTKRGPDGRPPPQDCLHWCMPGPVDTWNEMVMELIRREFEGSQKSPS